MITITKENLSRFNKRLKKSVLKHLNQDISLNVASTLFANALGVDSSYQLEEHFNTNNEKNEVIVVDYMAKAQALINEIRDYYQNNPTAFTSLSFNYVDNDLAIMILGKTLDNIEEGFGLYFRDNPNKYIKKYLSKFVHTPEEENFLLTICHKYFSEDKDENIFLSSRIIKITTINKEYLPVYFLYHKNTSKFLAN